MPELIEAVALAMIEEGVHSYKTCGREVIEAAEHIAAATCKTVLKEDGGEGEDQSATKGSP